MSQSVSETEAYGEMPALRGAANSTINAHDDLKHSCCLLTKSPKNCSASINKIEAFALDASFSALAMV